MTANTNGLPLTVRAPSCDRLDPAARQVDERVERLESRVLVDDRAFGHLEQRAARCSRSASPRRRDPTSGVRTVDHGLPTG
jgi:hypothetical protein